jgi:phage/conjugal plasmid C-4 type zinc finger TraR family protein
MADIVDKAQAAQELLLNFELAQQLKEDPATSLKFCRNCGARIPAKRRQAIKGVKLCVECQQERER